MRPKSNWPAGVNMLWFIQADRYVKAWNYMNNHADSKLVKKRMDEAWEKANQ